MSKHVLKTAVLLPETRAQIKDLFGTAPNALKRLGLTPWLSVAEMGAALCGYPIKPEVRDAVLRRWEQWREVFLRNRAAEEDGRSVTMTPVDEADAVASARGDCFDPGARDPITGKLLLPDVPRFTLLTFSDEK